MTLVKHQNNAFEMEKVRATLADQKQFNKLLKTYSGEYPEILDINTNRFWDEKYAEKYEFRNQDPMTKERINSVCQFIPEGKQKILDVGAGLGFIEEVISNDLEKVIYANDISEEAVLTLRKKYKGKFSVQSVYNLNYNREIFDVVLALELLEHIPPSKIMNVLKSIKKLLKDGGTLIVSVPLNENLEEMSDNPSGHVRVYTKDLLCAELSIAGFIVEDYKFLYAFSSMYNFKKLISKYTNKWKPNDVIIKAISI